MMLLNMARDSNLRLEECTESVPQVDTWIWNAKYLTAGSRIICKNI